MDMLSLRICRPQRVITIKLELELQNMPAASVRKRFTSLGVNYFLILMCSWAQTKLMSRCEFIHGIF